MLHTIFILFAILANIEANENGTLCSDFEVNFAMMGVIGSWYVVAIVPGDLFPEKEVYCYKVEFSETDEAGLRWLVNRTLDSDEMPQDIKGTIIRQRYHSEQAFDVWSKAVDGVNGCFQQVLSMDTDNSDIHKDLIQEATMQLHILENNTDPYLIQMLWGRMVTAVIYRKHRDVVTNDKIKPIVELIDQISGPQRRPRMCTKYLREKIVLN